MAKKLRMKKNEGSLDHTKEEKNWGRLSANHEITMVGGEENEKKDKVDFPKTEKENDD